MFSRPNHFITNFSQNAPVKNFDNRSIFDKDMDKTSWLTFWATLYIKKIADKKAAKLKRLHPSGPNPTPT